VIDEIFEDASRKPQPTRPMEKTLINSTENDEDVEEVEVKECVKQLEASKEQIQQPPLEDILGKKIWGFRDFEQ
jgi:hypothetical protein